MTEIWANHRRVEQCTFRDVDEGKAVEVDLTFPNGEHKTFWLLRGEY